MLLRSDVQLDYGTAGRTDMLIQIRAPSLADQVVRAENYDTGPATEVSAVAAEAGMGERTLQRVDGRFLCSYTADIDVDRPTLDISLLDAVPIHQLPGDVIRYLMQ